MKKDILIIPENYVDFLITNGFQCEEIDVPPAKYLENFKYLYGIEFKDAEPYLIKDQHSCCMLVLELRPEIIPMDEKTQEIYHEMHSLTVGMLISYLQHNFDENDKLCFWDEGEAHVKCVRMHDDTLGEIFFRKVKCVKK